MTDILALRKELFTELHKAITGSSLIRDMNIPDGIVRLMAELSMFRPLLFEKGGGNMTISQDGTTVAYGDSNYGYHVATADTSFSSGIHRYEVLVGPTPQAGCRYIGYVSNEGTIRYDEGIHACDYWAAWYVIVSLSYSVICHIQIVSLSLFPRDGSCCQIYVDVNGTQSWSNSKSQKAVAWKEGDRVLCELNCDEGTLVFYLNGKKLDNSLSGLGKGRKWVPAVGLRKPTQTITILKSEYMDNTDTV